LSTGKPQGCTHLQLQKFGDHLHQSRLRQRIVRLKEENGAPGTEAPQAQATNHLARIEDGNKYKITTK